MKLVSKINVINFASLYVSAEYMYNLRFSCIGKQLLILKNYKLSLSKTLFILVKNKQTNLKMPFL